MRFFGDFVEEVLGPYDVVADRSSEHRYSRVLEVSDADGVTWFAKWHRFPSRYRAEITAYRNWVPAVRDRAPVLRGWNDELPAVVLSAVPREGAAWLDVDAHGQAGVLLRTLHGAESLAPKPDFVEELHSELDYWEMRSNGLVERRHLDFARSELRALERLPPLPRVPCHLDYSPRNWLVSAGQLYVVDFELARPEPWVRDLGRLWFGPWRSRPELKDAFLKGYGRTPDDDELRLLVKGYPVTAVRDVILAHETRQEAFEAAVRDVLDALQRGEFDRPTWSAR